MRKVKKEMDWERKKDLEFLVLAFLLVAFFLLMFLIIPEIWVRFILYFIVVLYGAKEFAGWLTT